MASSSVTSLGVTFSECMNVQSTINSGSIVNAASLVDVSNGAVPLEANQFSYNDGNRTLTLSFDEPLSIATYELQLNGELLTDTEGNPLRGGSSGLAFQLPVFAAAETVQAGGSDIQTGNYSVPSLEDWNDDGLMDLIVGEKLDSGDSKVRVYLNSGTNVAPVYDVFSHAQSAGGGDLTVLGDGCMGVFPRMYDWNDDGLKDLVLGMADGSVNVARNENSNSEPVFGVPEPVEVGQEGEKIDVDVGKRATLDIVDWNNDGRYDLVLGGLDGSIRVLLDEANSGPPNFPSETLVLDAAVGQGVPTGRAGVAVADLNGDGRKDLVVGNTEGQLLFYANIGTDEAPQFAGYEAIEAGGATVDLAGDPRSRPFVGDANGDGRADLLVGAKDGFVRLYVASTEPTATDGAGNNEGEPGGTYTHTFRVVPAWQSPTHKNDVNGDGWITVLDVLALVNHLITNGQHELSESPVPPDAPPPYVDCNGDGNATTLDVLQAVIDLNTFGRRIVAEGEGGGTWAMYVGGSPIRGGEGESTQQATLTNAGNTREQEPQPQPSSPTRQADREGRGDDLPAITAEDYSADTSDLEEALSEIVSSLG